MFVNYSKKAITLFLLLPIINGCVITQEPTQKIWSDTSFKSLEHYCFDVTDAQFDQFISENLSGKYVRWQGQVFSADYSNVRKVTRIGLDMGTDRLYGFAIRPKYVFLETSQESDSLTANKGQIIEFTGRFKSISHVNSLTYRSECVASLVDGNIYKNVN